MANNDLMNMVLEFHKTFGVPVISEPKLPDYERCLLRYNLMKEELEEFKEAIDKGDVVESADALADLIYLVVGTVYEFGLGNVFMDIINEVHRSNMSKACDDENVAKETVNDYLKRGIKTYYKNINNKWVIYRCEDNKVLKSIKYTPPKIENIIK